jgi:hypothetical protein
MVKKTILVQMVPLTVNIPTLHLLGKLQANILMSLKMGSVNTVRSEQKML